MNVDDKWQQGDAYERYMGRWSRQLAMRFLQWLQAPSGLRWLDVGCGTGALCEAILAQAAPRSVAGVDPSAGFLDTAQARLAGRVHFQRGSASELPLADGAVDMTVASLVLNFVPDPHAALREMARVTESGGHVAACVWDYGGRMDLIRHYWAAAAAVGAGQGDEADRFPISRPGALAAAFEAAGLQAVQSGEIDLPMRFSNFDDYWQPFLGGQGPAPAHAVALADDMRQRVRECLRERLPVHADGSIVLAARAWSVVGAVKR